MSNTPIDTLRIQLFGPFRVERAGQPIAFARRKTAALLAYLALHPGEQPREQIAARFWGDAAEEDARRSLRVALADLRKALGDAALLGDRDTLALNPAVAAEIDAQRFARLLGKPYAAATADLLAGLALYRGDLLESLYDEWLLPLREHFRAIWLAALLLLIERYRAAGDYANAIQQARRLLQREPAHETGHQHLIFCLAAGGEREAALAQVETCRAALRQHLDADLAAETLALAESIGRQGAEGAGRLTNLPRPLTSFIGREAELEQIETLLAQTRLLTLTGPCGSGKTRLAIQSADEASHGYPDGVWWVDLASLAEPELVAGAIARTLGVVERGGESLLALTAGRIGGQRLLLVLDTCEHLLAACAQVAEFLLGRCPGLAMLAVSREPLDLSGEVAWETPPFPTPAEGSDLRALRRNESVRLFVERARAANAGFQLGAGNAAAVAGICRRLEGIPLAIELAAAQMDRQSPAEIELGLNQTGLRREFSRTGDALRAAIQWSYDLLSPVQQILFRRLAVFDGGWDLAAASIVAAGYAEPQAPLAAVAGPHGVSPLPVSGEAVTRQVLENLARKGLVRVHRSAESVRYDLLDTLRGFASEKLVEADETRLLSEAHYAWCLTLAEAAEPGLRSTGQTRLGDALSQELPNLRAALEWASAAGQNQAGLRLAAALGPLWLVRCYFVEGMAWLERFLAHAPDAPSPTRAQALYWLGDLAYRRNDAAKTQAACQASLEICEALDDRPGQARAWRGLGMAAWLRADYPAADAAAQQSLDLYRALDDLNGCAHAVNILAEAARIQNRHEEAVAYNQQALEIMRQMGNRRAEGIAILNLGLLAVAQAQFTEGGDLLRAAGQIFLETGEKHHIVYVLDGLGRAYQKKNQLTAAARLYGALHAYSAATQFTLFGPDLAEYERNLADLRAAISPAAFAQAWRQGAALGAGEVVAWAIAQSYFADGGAVAGRTDPSL
jgi:predicted ATPase/DNA-binding SARP family transcriptional activator